MKVLIGGLGSIGQRHARNLRAILGTNVELIALRSRGNALVINETMAVEEGVAPEERYQMRCFTDLAAALRAKPDAAFITNPSSLHLQLALPLAEAGCHLFIEKPLAHSRDGVGLLVAAAKRSGAIVHVGFQLRFHPALRSIKNLLSDNVIGPALSARFEFGEYLPGAHPYEDYRQGYAAREDLGGGAVLCLIHELDALIHLFGMPRRVFAVGGKLSSLEMDAEDLVAALYECTTPDGRVFPVEVHLDFVQRPPSRVCQIVGDGGKILWDYHQNTLRTYEAAQDAWRSECFASFQRNQMYIDEVRHFLNCIAGQETQVVSLADGVRSLDLALATKESFAGRRIVEIPTG